jgi:hypothetical protein
MCAQFGPLIRSEAWGCLHEDVFECCDLLGRGRTSDVLTSGQPIRVSDLLTPGIQYNDERETRVGTAPIGQQFACAFILQCLLRLGFLSDELHEDEVIFEYGPILRVIRDGFQPPAPPSPGGGKVDEHVFILRPGFLDGLINKHPGRLRRLILRHAERIKRKESSANDECADYPGHTKLL